MPRSFQARTMGALLPPPPPPELELDEEDEEECELEELAAA